jgi:putative transposase
MPVWAARASSFGMPGDRHRAGDEGASWMGNGSADDQDRVRVEKAQALGLFRFQLISPAIDDQLSTRARGRLVRQCAQGWHTDPFGNRVRYSRDTLDRWIRLWRQGGFAALVPSPRQTPLRTDADILDVAAALKRENPARTAAQVRRILVAAKGWAPSESTLLRLFHRLELPGADGRIGGGDTVFGRFEAGDPNELWTGDALHGRRLGGRKTYLFAFIDDNSRLLPGYRWGFAEDTVRLAAPFRQAVQSRGIPQALYVDNGSAYIDSWLLRACAKLGVRLTHSTPGRPQGRGKIERFFGTVNEQFLVEVHDSTAEELTAQGISQAAALLELNRLFAGWVETVYHVRVHTETEQTPLARWADGWERTGKRPQIPGTDDLAEAFRWAEFRSVTKTATVSLFSNSYQVDPSLTGRRVELVFDPFDMTDIAVNHHGKSFGKAVPHTVTRHSHPKARPETAEEKPAPTGIDYLNLVAGEHHGHRGVAINFRALAGRATEPATRVDDAAPDPTPDTAPDPAPVTEPGQVPGQLPLPNMPITTPKGVDQ